MSPSRDWRGEVRNPNVRAPNRFAKQPELGRIASFQVGGLEDIDRHYDVVYTSNVLEHFAEYQSAARHLLRNCHRLCVMVPHREVWNQRALRPSPDLHHQHTFAEDSFDFVVPEGGPAKIATYTVACIAAWGWSRWDAIQHLPKNLVRRMLGKKPRRPPLQIIYDIVATAGREV